MSRTRCLTLLGFLFLTVLPGEVRAAAFRLRGEASLVCGTGLDFDIREGLVFVNKRGMAKAGWEANAAGKVATWVARYGSVTFNLVGREFPWAGMNEAGLVLSSVGLPESECEAPDSRPVAGDGFWVQHMLDNCATVDEVIGHTDSIRLARTVDHYLACDAGGDCAVIEFLGGRMVVHRGDELPVAALTGASYEASLAAYREKRIWQLMRGLSDGWDDSLYRFIRTARKLARFESGRSEPAVEEAVAILAYLATDNSRWRIVFDIGRRRIRYTTDENPEPRTLDFADLDFGCASPIQMMNIDAGGPGDAAAQLEAYSAKTNLDHLCSFMTRRKGKPVDRPEYEQFQVFLDSYSCTE